MDQTTILLARSFSVAAAGIFSWAMIDLVVSNRLSYYLADQKFELLVIIGGVLLGLIVLLKLRGLAMGVQHSHPHDHDHDPHDHHGHAHDHGGDHGHGHSVSLWRFIVLAFPLMIILLGLAPKEGLSIQAVANRMTAEQRDSIAKVGNASLPAGRSAEGKLIPANGRELHDAAYDPVRREMWESIKDPVRANISGQFVPNAQFNDRFQLMRLKIVCCNADATPVGVNVIGAIDPSWKYGDWLEVHGPVSFVEVPGKSGSVQILPVLHQQEVKRTAPKPYIQ